MPSIVRSEPLKQRGVREASVTREKFIASQPGERNFEPDFTSRPGYEVCVNAVHRRLVEPRHGFVDARKHGAAIERNLRMRCAASFSDFARQGSFVVRSSRERQGEAPDSPLRARRKRGDRPGIKSARKKKSHRHVRDQMRTHGIFKKRAQL